MPRTSYWCTFVMGEKVWRRKSLGVEAESGHDYPKVISIHKYGSAMVTVKTKAQAKFLIKAMKEAVRFVWSKK